MEEHVWEDDGGAVHQAIHEEPAGAESTPEQDLSPSGKSQAAGPVSKGKRKKTRKKKQAEPDTTQVSGDGDPTPEQIADAADALMNVTPEELCLLMDVDLDAESVVEEPQSGDPELESAGDIPMAAPKLVTTAELLEEYFPGAKSVSGGTLAGLEREKRRRNRRAEKGY